MLPKRPKNIQGNSTRMTHSLTQVAWK